MFVNMVERSDRDTQLYGEHHTWDLMVLKAGMCEGKRQSRRRPVIKWLPSTGFYVVHAFFIAESPCCPTLELRDDDPLETLPEASREDFEEVFFATCKSLHNVYGTVDPELHIFYHRRPVSTVHMGKEIAARSQRRLQHRNPSPEDLCRIYRKSLETAVENCFLGLMMASHFASASDRSVAERALHLFGQNCVQEGNLLRLYLVF